MTKNKIAVFLLWYSACFYVWLLSVQKDIFLPCAESRFRFGHSSAGLILSRRPTPKFVKRAQEVKLKSMTEELGAPQTAQNKRIQWGRETGGVGRRRGIRMGSSLVLWVIGQRAAWACRKRNAPLLVSVKPSPKQQGLSEVTHPRWQNWVGTLPWAWTTLTWHY